MVMDGEISFFWGPAQSELSIVGENNAWRHPDESPEGCLPGAQRGRTIGV